MKPGKITLSRKGVVDLVRFTLKPRTHAVEGADGDNAPILNGNGFRRGATGIHGADAARGEDFQLTYMRLPISSFKLPTLLGDALKAVDGRALAPDHFWGRCPTFTPLASEAHTTRQFGRACVRPFAARFGSATRHPSQTEAGGFPRRRGHPRSPCARFCHPHCTPSC